MAKASGLFEVRKKGQSGKGGVSYDLDPVTSAAPTGDKLTATGAQVGQYEGNFWVKVVDGKVTKAGKTRKDVE